jgi:DNA helicase-2/ATP-dependent DNA helicase PcrA
MREALKAGGQIDLRGGLPPSVRVIVAENQARSAFDYQLASADRRPIDAFVTSEASLLVLTHFNDTARSLRAFFRRRLPLWEGHTRAGLEALVDATQNRRGDPGGLAKAIVRFMGDVGKGFSPSAFGDRFEREAREGCSGRASGKPAAIQGLAGFLVAEPDHHGVAKALRQLAILKRSRGDFADIDVDCHNEFWEAVRLGEFEDAEEGFAEITHHRTYLRPKPPAKAISTIHKAKGLECRSVVVMPCDAQTFSDKPEARCLLYVVLSRATDRLLLVVSRNRPSPLFLI